ncbi:hypothetical protein [Pseudophaeobacter leonis]|uniref:hypothetical protein n=1 Tax=Pseudophaeobacter leonis TaxID=1144477 RepID=UPI00111C8103|nr:hypothetical protein [Pseudophaeobacter leonis]
MAKQICDGLGSNPDEDITSNALAGHLGISRNSVPAIMAKFALTKRNNRFRKYDVFRQVHGLEPLLMDAALANFITAHGCTIGDGTCDADDTVGRICLIDGLSGINNLASALWDQGLIHISDLAVEYGYAYDTFRKKLKSGDINLPPIQPIELSSNRIMYRPLDVVLWRRHGIVMNLPKATGSSSGSVRRTTLAFWAVVRKWPS